jgi:hypothetical protein
MSTSRYVQIRPDNIPADGKISFKNGFPMLSFTISAQDGLLDPSTIRVTGNFNVYSDNLATPTPAVDDDELIINPRLGIYSVIESLTVRSQKSKLICENIRHYSKFMNSYLAMTSSLEDQMGHLSQTCLISPNVGTMEENVIISPTDDVGQTNSFSFHLPSGFLSSGNMVDLRQDAFGGIIVEMLLQPDSNVLFQLEGDSTGLGDAHYELSNLFLTCEVSDFPDGQSKPATQGAYEFNTITSLYSSINSTNAQIQYSLGLSNVQSAFMTFVPVASINTLTQDGQVTVQLSGDGSSNTALAPIRKVQFLKGGVKYPADFDYTTNIVDDANTKLVDPQIIRNFVDAILPDYTYERFSISPVNCNRDYNMTTVTTGNVAYGLIPEGGAVYGLGVKYGIGGAGEDFTTEQFGVSIESDLRSDRPMGVYIFVKSRATLAFKDGSVQISQ